MVGFLSQWRIKGGRVSGAGSGMDKPKELGGESINRSKLILFREETTLRSPKKCPCEWSFGMIAQGWTGWRIPSSKAAKQAMASRACGGGGDGLTPAV
jgi:hypothetical protein